MSHERTNRPSEDRAGPLGRHPTIGDNSARVRPPESSTQQGPLSTPPPAGSFRRTLRVLVVDDNVDAAESLGMLISIWGHEVRIAYDGKTAIEEAMRHRPEVILLDIGLPGFDGYEVARRIRGDARLDRTLLLAMTGYGHDEDRRRSEEAGFDRHLVKPVDPTEVHRLISTYVERRGRA